MPRIVSASRQLIPIFDSMQRRMLNRRVLTKSPLLPIDTTGRRGPLAAELLLHEPRVRDGLGVPRVSWTGPEDAREGRPVLSLGPEPQACACLTAQTEVGDQLRPGQGQEVQVSARLVAPRTAVEERRTRTSWQGATQDRESLGSPVVEGDHDGVGLPVGAIWIAWQHLPSSSDTQKTTYCRLRGSSRTQRAGKVDSRGTCSTSTRGPEKRRMSR